ncbi:hypothetical protein KC19_9G096000 [Ceratodon purpureus]|uniref:Peptidase A1 domain-containing protein n=1 Tax=Ceratodon purpureus TaxID=3225 RepID=A0A8T0GUM1_CERPU|nr:hypothetical protein KC19_9G096000 [Ceratodon purpureus]
MRRGGRGSIVPSPRTEHHDGAIPSGLHLDRRWGGRNCVKVIVLAAISIIIWSSRPGRLQGHHRLGYDVQSRNSGFVFPLYRYYQQYPNGSHVVGGLEKWRGSRVGFHGRRIRSEESLFELHGGGRIDDGVEIEDFYIKIKLGDPPKPFHLHVDTAGGPPSWVFCNDLGRYGSFINTLGPNGLFVPGGNSFVKCTGETESLCLTLQAAGKQECDRKDDYDCLFAAKYFDGSSYWGHIVNESITLPMMDRTERKVFGLFGCTFENEGDTETKPLITDGVIALGNCKGTLVDQLSTTNDISQNILGVCLAKGMIPASPAAHVGFISLGMNFEEKFNQQSDSISNWVKLLNQPGVLCAYGAKLLYIFVDQKRITVRSSDKTVGMAVYFDTGSDVTYLHKDVYDQVLKAGAA